MYRGLISKPNPGHGKTEEKTGSDSQNLTEILLGHQFMKLYEALL